MSRPIVVLQMQRMGDLLLTFPLLVWLSRRYPGHPIWVVAEKSFFTGLMPLSPHVMYIPWEDAGRIAHAPLELVINLSHRPEAAELAGQLTAQEIMGPMRTPQGTYIRGDFQLYRAALTHCNRHNRFHWAELNALDVIPLPEIAATSWAQPRTLEPSARSVGLFLGASDRAKRPTSLFWAQLAQQLGRRGLNPVLLGGPAEVELGERVAAMHGGRLLNQCGRLSLADLAGVLQSVSLVVTADTGPMHLAAWVGTRVLNLSMGPVNPWETGPYQPGHTVLMPSASCAGCWECPHPEPPCRAVFDPQRVASLAARLRAGQDIPAALRLPGQRLRQTSRDCLGLYHLAERPTGQDSRLEGCSASGCGPVSARDAVSCFWRAYFGWIFGLWGIEQPGQAMAMLAYMHPRIAEGLRKAVAGLGRDVAGQGISGEGCWEAYPPATRLLASFLQLLVHNADGSAAARRKAMQHVSSVLSL